MKIAVASGKGGTGKTTVALALAQTIGGGTEIVDCDVEAPNCHLFIKAESTEQPAKVLKPVLNNKLCDGCGRCREMCQFNAISIIGKTALLFSDLCHSCGGCCMICLSGALTEREHKIGETRVYEMRDITLLDGSLSIGQTVSPQLIHAVKTRIRKSANYVIIDSPPGTACQMVAAVQDSDFVILVTEPTPFGLHDLDLAVNTLQLLRLPFGVIINRTNSGNDQVKTYCRNKNIPVLMEIEDRMDVAIAYSNGNTFLDAVPELRPNFAQMIATIEEILAEGVEK